MGWMDLFIVLTNRDFYSTAYSQWVTDWLVSKDKEGLGSVSLEHNLEPSPDFCSFIFILY